MRDAIARDVARTPAREARAHHAARLSHPPRLTTQTAYSRSSVTTLTAVCASHAHASAPMLPSASQRFKRREEAEALPHATRG